MIETIFKVILIILILSVVLTVISGVVVTFDYSFNYGALLTNFLHVACYIFPFKKCIPILVTVVSVTVLKIAVSVLRTLWDIFPLRG